MDVVLDVKGMSCEHCEKAVKNALSDLNGVNDVKVDVQNDKVDVKYDQTTVSLEQICETIENQGYDVVHS